MHPLLLEMEADVMCLLLVIKIKACTLPTV